MRRASIALLVILALFATACGSADEGVRPQRPADAPRIVATTPVLGDLVDHWPLADGDLLVLMSDGQDPHGYQPSAQDVQALHQADLVIANGLGLEAGLEGVLASVEAEGGVVLRLGEHADPMPYSGDHDHDDEDGHEDEDEGDGSLDPHFWLDPLRVAEALPVLEAALVEIGMFPEDQARVAGDHQRESLESLAKQVQATLAVVPEQCRVLVTNHDALGYFADRFGFEIVGTVLPGSSTEAEPSAKDLAALVEVIRDRGVPAIFVETTEARDVAEAVASEVGDVRVVEVRVTPAQYDPAQPGQAWLAITLQELAEAVAVNMRDC